LPDLYQELIMTGLRRRYAFYLTPESNFSILSGSKIKAKVKSND
jgi:hypothetical protein